MLMLIITEIFEIRNLKIVFLFQYFPHLLLQMISIASMYSTILEIFCSGSVRLSQVVKDAATLHGLELGEEVGVGFRHRSLLLHLHIPLNIIKHLHIALNIIGIIGT